MAISEEIKEQKKKLKGKGIKAHLQWFWDYEKVPTVAVLAAAALAAGIIIQAVTYKSPAVGILFMGADVTDQDQGEELGKDFLQYAGIDGGKHTVFTDFQTISTDEDGDMSNVYVQEKVVAELAANQIDAAVMDEKDFNSYLSNELFMNLEEALDQETLDRYRDRLYYADRAVVSKLEESGGTAQGYLGSADPSGMKDPVPVGVIVNDAPYIAQHHNYDGTTAICGFVSGTEHTDLCASFLDYLFQIE